MQLKFVFTLYVRRFVLKPARHRLLRFCSSQKVCSFFHVEMCVHVCVCVCVCVCVEGGRGTALHSQKITSS